MQDPSKWRGVVSNFPLGLARFAFLILLPIEMANLAANAATNPLGKVRSFEFVLGGNADTTGIYSAIANSKADLVILGGGSYSHSINRAAADPTGTKLIFGALNVCEATAYEYPSLFAGGNLPSWFGNPNPGYTGLYTVQYWNPAWEPQFFAVLDKIIADGYDGAFLDNISGDFEWSAGNPEGNFIYPNAVGAMATLIADIRNYLNGKYPGKAFYLIGNNPTDIALANASSLKNLDGIFNEIAYYQQIANNGAVAAYIGTLPAANIQQVNAPLYATAGIPVFGNDYPTPLSDTSADLLSFNLYSSLGWIPSVTTAFQSPAIFSTGPFMFMATASNPTVAGYAGFPNFISGGTAASTILTGGNQGDYFIGGPGQNTITGGAGNDTIYAHPANATQKGKLIFDFSSTIKGSATTPSVSVSINGAVAIQATPITAQYHTTTQTFTLNASAFASISSMVITVTGASNADQNNFSNVEINDIIFNGARIDLSTGTYTSGSGAIKFVYSNNGTVTLPALSFAVTSPFLANTSDTIDGGGGTNTVVYRGASGNYLVSKQPDGSWLVTSLSTAEGPDRLINIQTLIFSDQQISLTGTSRISNLSVRTNLASGQTLVVGFVTSGAKNLLIRAVGPSLNAVFGITNFYADPMFTINNGQGTIVDQNDNWSPSLSATFSSLGAFALTNGGKDAALVRSSSGPNTAQVSGTGSGIMLVEVYDDDSVTSSARLTNVSSRNQVGIGDNVLVSGFVIAGSAPEKLLIRGIGPALHDVFGVNGVLADPVLEIHQTINGVDTIIASNNDWSSTLTTTFDAVGAYHFTSGSKDAALLITLLPGTYTAQVSGANSGTGDGVVEIYEVP